jgi:hypothetical protein
MRKEKRTILWFDPYGVLALRLISLRLEDRCVDRAVGPGVFMIITEKITMLLGAALFQSRGEKGR